MHIPAVIKIGAHEIPVESHSERQHEALGYYDSGYDRISLKGEDHIPESKRAECLLHEIIEAICHKYELSLSDRHRELTTLSEVLFQTVRDSELDFRKPK